MMSESDSRTVKPDLAKCVSSIHTCDALRFKCTLRKCGVTKALSVLQRQNAEPKRPRINQTKNKHATSQHSLLLTATTGCVLKYYLLIARERTNE
mgnify:CR=1 FL=1